MVEGWQSCFRSSFWHRFFGRHGVRRKCRRIGLRVSTIRAAGCAVVLYLLIPADLTWLLYGTPLHWRPTHMALPLPQRHATGDAPRVTSLFPRRDSLLRSLRSRLRMGFVISLQSWTGEISLLWNTLRARMTAYARSLGKPLAGENDNLSSQPLNASRGRVRGTDNK